jgi:hypothetical protein
MRPRRESAKGEWNEEFLDEVGRRPKPDQMKEAEKP